MFIVIHMYHMYVKRAIPKTVAILKRSYQIKYTDGMIMFLLFKNFHRTNGPAIISSLQMHWFVKGKQHRQDGPAFISITRFGCAGIKEWWFNGKKHRLDGPAVTIYYFNSGTPHLEKWFINGLQTKEIVYSRNKDIISETFFLNGKRIGKQFNSDCFIDCMKS